MKKPKLIRITTIPLSMDKLLEGQLKFMSDYFDITAVSSADGDYLHKVAEREGVSFYPIEMTRAITPAADLKALFSMVKFLRHEKPLIVHSHTPKAGTIGMLAARIAGVPIRLHTVAGMPLMEITGTKRKLLNAVEKVTYAAATKVLPNSFGLKDIILDNKFTTADKLHVIGQGSSNGINTGYFDPVLFSEAERAKLRNELEIKPDDFVFIFVGRLVKDKGIEELVEAFINLDKPESKLLLVGSLESELDPLSERTLDEIQQNPNIIMAGWQSDVRPYFAVSDALAFPSYREGFPNVVMQAGAMGLPAIVSDINGCNEIIHEGQNGLIVPVKNTVFLTQAMKELTENKLQYDSMKELSRGMIEKHFSRTYIWEELENFYQQEINKVLA